MISQIYGPLFLVASETFCLLIVRLFLLLNTLCRIQEQISQCNWRVQDVDCKSSNFLQISDLPIIMNTLDNSDDAMCQIKLYQATISLYLSTFGPNSIYLNP